MNIPAVPQPQRWGDLWLWLNRLYTSAELSQRFWYDAGVWYEF